MAYNQLYQLSTDVSVALTDHPWYDGSIDYQRMLPFPIARVERPAQLLDYKLLVVSMESFQPLMTTSYQLFTFTKTRISSTPDHLNVYRSAGIASLRYIKFINKEMDAPYGDYLGEHKCKPKNLKIKGSTFQLNDEEIDSDENDENYFKIYII
uniref:Uncharacterized protein n=1 Tax=Glossina austeni TaxID=7395 RepID=A0A1A9VBT9_GLOAU